jgi:3-oxoacyl-[acyl-carrier protein] reductase
MTQDFDTSGKTVLVVGGSSGIGNGIAQAFRARGAVVHVWGTKAAAENYAGVEGSDLEGLHYSCVDVSKVEVVKSTPVTFESLDVLVLSQGTVIYQGGEFEMDGFEHVMDVNLTSLMSCALRFHDMLSAQNGSLITISSTAALSTTLGNPAYGTSKAAAYALTRNLAKSWARDGIRVNGIAPGLVDTKLTKVTTENSKRLEGSLKAIPAHRLGTPGDMAGAALFLASAHSSYIYGQTIVVDGGLTL